MSFSALVTAALTSSTVQAEETPTVVLAGHAPDIKQALGAFRVVAAAPEALQALTTDAVDVVVVEASAITSANTSIIREVARRIPLVISSAGAADELEALGSTLGAAEVAHRPVESAPLSRRVGALAELRRLRRALAITNAAMEQSSTGLTLGNPRRPGAPLVYVSPTFETLTGHPASEVVGRTCSFLQGAETDPATVARIRETVASCSTGRFTVRNYKKDGTPFWNELTIFPVLDDNGELLYLGGSQQDVTEAVTARAEVARARDELHARHEFTRQVLDGLHAAVITTDDSLRVTLMNQAACALVGASANRVGDSIDKVLALPASSAEWFREVKDGRGKLEYTHLLPGSPTRELSLSIRRAASTTAAGIGYSIILRDVAEARDAERIERLAAVSTMAAGFAHEVRNPLASLRMLGETLQAEFGREDPNAEVIDRMMNQVARIERLVRTSLQFARPQKPRKRLQWPSMIINAVLEALEPRTRRMAGLNALQVDMPEGLPKVDCDDAQMVQVLVVLVNNALDATNDPARIKISVREEKDIVLSESSTTSVVFTIEDDGPGVPEHLRAAIFHPFFTTKPSGTGLGLSIAQQLVLENGGRIELVPPADGRSQGARFTVLLPARNP